MKTYVLTLLAAVTFMTSCKTNQYADLGDGLFAELHTTHGDIILKLEYEKTPVTVANFVSLAEGTNPHVSEEFKGKKYYDGLTFHRVMQGFMIQGGDPTGTGRGNPGYRFKDEFVDSLVHNRKGVLSMANGGPKTNGSQFFITHAPAPHLDGRHTVFGEVVYGLEVVDSIASVPVSQGDNRPVTQVTMEKVDIVRKGADARKFDAVAVMDAYFAEEQALQDRIAAFAADLQSQRILADSLPSGLKIKVLHEGPGPKPALDARVRIHYAGWLENGTLFDTSVDSVARAHGRFDEMLQAHGGSFDPLTVNYSPEIPLIAGFKEALLKMAVGDKWRVFIPPHLGYGQQGYGPIPPQTHLVFDLELLGVEE